MDGEKPAEGFDGEEELPEEVLSSAGGDSGGEEETGGAGRDAGVLPSLVEAILFTSQKPVSAKEIAGICKGAAVAYPNDARVAALGKFKEAELRAAVDFLGREYEKSGRSFEVKESAAGWQLVTKADFAPWLRQLFPENRPARLSAPAMETLAIIAYRQPLTRADIEAVRGVAVDGVMQTLLEKGLIKIAGRSDQPGRALLYETTQHFMEHFGLKNLEELPNSRELRSVPLPQAEEKKGEAPKKSKQGKGKAKVEAAEVPQAEGEKVAMSEEENPAADTGAGSLPEIAEEPIAGEEVSKENTGEKTGGQDDRQEGGTKGGTDE